jgi:glycosyltransferase A (GT-A) superfamily protein (DUF2064 family)
VTAYVHLVEGDSAADRLARVAQLAKASRRPVLLFAETSAPACTPLDWLMGPGCTCCLPPGHPRQRLMQAAADASPCRIIIDAGPPALADRIAALLEALPVPLRLRIL